ncbi:MAG: PQQ-binding-like beta-propeller repeat protein [Bryobacteraceae bacterium]
MQRILSIAAIAAISVGAGSAEEWGRFRGANGTGVADAKNLPVEMNADKNLVWRTEIPAGYSSPVVGGDKIFLTTFDKAKKAVYTMGLDRKTGKILWQKEAPSVNAVAIRSVNTPVSPTPVTDGKGVYVFFESAGLVGYTPDGEQKWHLPLGPFKTPYGPGASPILAGDTLLFLMDQDVDSFLLAVDTSTGKVKWKTARRGVTHGFSTPVLFQPKKGPLQVLVSGSYELQSYSVATGEKLWWVGGMAWQAKSEPIVAGDHVYVHSWMADMSGVGLPPQIDPWEKVLESHDKDKDGKLSREELPYDEMKKLMFLFDLNADKFIDADEWKVLFARNSAVNGVYSIKLPQTDAEQKGDLTKTNVEWRYAKSLPNIPSPLLIGDVLFLLREGGVLTALNAKTGEVIKQGRVKDALDPYYASPIAGDGKIYLASQSGKLSVIQAIGEWEILAVNDLKEEIWSTPAIDKNQIIVRTQTALYCFGNKS